MRQYSMLVFAAILTIGLVTGVSDNTVMAEEMTITGTVNELSQIETEDEEVYSIDKNKMGEELKTLVGKRVEATGEVEEGYGGIYVITVTSYKIVE